MSDARVDRLAVLMAEMIALLGEHDHLFWRQNLTTARNALLRGDPAGVRRLLSLYGEGQSLTAQLQRADETERREAFLTIAAEARELAMTLSG